MCIALNYNNFTLVFSQYVGYFAGIKILLARIASNHKRITDKGRELLSDFLSSIYLYLLTLLLLFCCLIVC